MPDGHGAEWLYEAGIGENRAALVDGDVILQAEIETDEPGLRVGAVLDARVVERVAGHGIVAADGHEAYLEPVPREWTNGARVRVEVAREALPERGVRKRARARPTDAPPRAAPTLRERIAGETRVVEVDRHGPDRLEAAGWSELLAQAAGAPVTFDCGRLHVEPTRAMTLIDVDGWGPVDALGVAAATASASTIRRLGLAGSIGIDFPSAGRDARAAAAAAFDAGLPLPFERTAINGFGFMQVIRPRARRSLVEIARLDAGGAAARALLRRAERSGLTGATRLVAHPVVAAALKARPDWLDLLARASGGAVGLRANPALAMWSGHVERA